MDNIIISPDKNTVTIGTDIHKFNTGDSDNCDVCTLFKKCCQLQETVESEFPFPCVATERNDDQYGNFQLEKS